MAKDPVCGMTVDEATARSAEKDGKIYYFCSRHCEESFLSEGARAKAESGGPPGTPTGGAAYYCPMCEGVESDEPGQCPKCGMDLQSAGPGAGDLNAMTRRLWVSAAFAAPAVLLAMSDMVPGLRAVGRELSRWLQLVLSTPVVLWGAWPFFGILLSPIIAAAAMSASSVSVVGNALRLRSVEL